MHNINKKRNSWLGSQEMSSSSVEINFNNNNYNNSESNNNNSIINAI
jgi:hypothetical protein